MRNIEALALVEDLVQTFGTVDAVLEAVQDAPTPRKKRSAKKMLRKWLRTYQYYTSMKGGE